MDSIPQNEDTDEDISYSQDMNAISSNSLLSSVDNRELPEIQIECNEASHNLFFENILQSKKKSQAFSPQRQISTSPLEKNILKEVSTDNKTQHEIEIQENFNCSRKSPIKGDNVTNRTQSVIEEIEFLKGVGSLQSTTNSIDEKLLYISSKQRSRSKSSEKGFLFPKREKKVRNYRRSDTYRRSPSPVISKPKKEKPVGKTNRFKYPRNWEEFKNDKWTLGKLLPKASHSSIRSSSKDISQQLLFETPAETIKTFFYKGEKGGEVLVPYQFLRYTSAKPRISYNVNLNNVKENYLNREQILNKTNKNYREILEKFLNRNTRTKFKTSEPIGQRNWYQRNWRDNESKVLETSIGLSFLQNYSDDEDEEDELSFELSTITKSEQRQLEGGDAILNKRSDIEYFEDNSGNERNKLIDKNKISGVIAEKIKFYDCKEVVSDATKEADKKMNEFTHSLVQELDMLRNRTESESFHEGMIENIDASWTPERIEQTFDTTWDETPKKKKEKVIINENRKSKQRLHSNSEHVEEKQNTLGIQSEDEWDETPKRKEENIKKSKKRLNKKRSETDSSSDERHKVKRKKKKIDRRKQKEKVRKARKKKEKIKAEKLKLKKEKKRKQKEKEKELVEKEILKKLKKEIEQNLEEVEREEREEEINKNPEKTIDKSIKIKIEKEENYEENVRSPEDLRNYLDKKTGKINELKEKVKKQYDRDKESLKSKALKKEISSKTVMEIKEPFNSEIKQEKICKEGRHKNVYCHFTDKKQSTEQAVVEELYQLEQKMKKPCVMEVPVDDIKLSLGEIEERKMTEEQTNKIKSKEELVCETTPDTDEYHSNWESDDGVSSVVKISTKKETNRWESDEELFTRTYMEKKDSGNQLPCDSAELEIPLHLKKFSRRRRNSKLSSGRQRQRSPTTYLDVDSEIKLLEAERINLSKERMQLEMEKIRIHELEREKSMGVVQYIGDPTLPPNWEPESFRKKQNKRHSRWDLREDHVDSSTSRDKIDKSETQRPRSREKEKFGTQDCDKSSKFTNIDDANLSSNVILSIPSSPEITSTECLKPTVLESAYQEFMKAVSTGDDSKEYLVISSADSDPQNTALKDENLAHQKKTKLTRSERDRNHGRSIKKIETLEKMKIQGITDPNLLRDILLPGEVPIEEIPMPVPSPMVDILQNLPSTIVVNTISAVSVPEFNSEVNISQDSQESSSRNSDQSISKKPFSFSSLVLPSKKPVLLEKSNWKLDEDSDEEPPLLKTKLEDLKVDQGSLLPVVKEVVSGNLKAIAEPNILIGKINEASRTVTLDKKKEPIVEKTGDIEDKRNDTEDMKRDTEDKRKDDDRRKDTNDRRKDGDDRRKDVGDKKKDSEDKKNAEDKRKISEDRRKDDKSSKRKRSRSKTPLDKRRRDEDARRREEDQRRKDEDERRRMEDARRKDEDTRRKDNDKRRKEDENKRRDSDSRKKDDDIRKKEDELKRRERDRRTISPQRHRDSSPRRRRNSSPLYRRASPRHRSPLRRQDSLRRGDRRSPSRSSPTRRKRSHSPNRRTTSTRRRSSSPKEKSPRLHQYLRRSKSPRHSPMDVLKRSLADSTISDDLLPQPGIGEASDSPLSSSSTLGSVLKKARITASPKRPSLDDRINQVLGVETQPSISWKQEVPQTYFHPQETIYQSYHQPFGPSTSSMDAPITSKVVQVGNILQVVPTEEVSLPPPPPQFTPAQKIVQVGNMLQIVPSEMEVILPPLPPPPPPKEISHHEAIPISITLPEKQSAEAILAAKNAERLAERAKKRREKEERKKEKDKKRKEREKKRKIKLRMSTEDVIKRALEMDGLIVDDNDDLSAIVPEIINDTPGLDPSKSILSNSTSRHVDPANKPERGKSVQFADGVRPGEGTSPSGGEELSSPPPQTEQLPKMKKYRKMETKKKRKRKIKVKVVKRRQSTPDSDQEYENLPPPSPPPGSPPPHVFPPRVKVHTINNIPQHYLPSYGITTAPQQQMIGQPPAVMNMNYPTAGGGVYRPTQQPHVNVIGPHYARASHSQNVGGHMHTPSQLVHSAMTTGMTHREHQPFGSY